MTAGFSYFERALRWTLRQHFRIPPGAFWAALLIGALLVFFVPLPLAWAAVGLAVIGLVGVMRWRHYRRGDILLVLPQPVTVDGDDPLAARAQHLILESLGSRLTADELALVRPIPARLGPTDLRLADAVRRRLGAVEIVLGRVDKRADGGWSLFSGVVSSSDEEVVHLDFHTRDRTPARANWTLILNYLSPTRDVQDVQDPLLVSGEIEPIVRSLAGHVAALVGDLQRAESEFHAAIDSSDDSNAWPIDELRCALAGVLMDHDRRHDALHLLRERAARPDPSPELLRQLARYLGRQSGDFDDHLERAQDEADHVEAVAALRRAAEVRTDPKRPMTLYNLASLPGREQDAKTEDLLREAMASSRVYRQAWYTHRALGSLRYHAAAERLEAGDQLRAKELFAHAARHYAAALRRRPKLRIWWRRGGTRHLYVRFPGSPILHANAQDAFVGAGHLLRARWHAWRTHRLRQSRLKRANTLFERREWLAAYANYDFAVIGRQDFTDAYAQVMRSVCLQQEGHFEEAEADFAEADTRFPDVALILRLGCLGSMLRRCPRAFPAHGRPRRSRCSRSCARGDSWHRSCSRRTLRLSLRSAERVAVALDSTSKRVQP